MRKGLRCRDTGWRWRRTWFSVRGREGLDLPGQEGLLGLQAGERRFHRGVLLDEGLAIPIETLLHGVDPRIERRSVIRGANGGRRREAVVLTHDAGGSALHRSSNSQR